MKYRFYLVFFVLVLLSIAPVAFAADTTAANGATNGFVPLTQIPAIRDVAAGNDLPTFFNNLYKYAVGAAAALALFMIMYGGFTWMMSGDNTEKRSQAKKYIQNALFGLLLVLSPAIVFSIINPNILSLKIAFGSLAPSTSGSVPAATAGTPANPTPSTIDSTGKINGACTLMPDGTIIKQTGDSAQNQAEQCCVRQTANGKKCTIGQQYGSDLSVTEFCKCS